MSWRPTSAFVLAAGLGTRMQPLTERMPKAMVGLGGRALIDHVLDRITAAGVRKVVVNVHHHADLLTAHLAGREEPRIVISDERRKLLDTGGGAKRALARLGREAFLVHNCDSVWIEGLGSNLERLFAHWDEARMDCLMLLALAATTIGYDGRGDFRMAPDGKLSRPAEKLLAPFVFTGVSIMHPRLLDDTPDGAFSLNMPWDRAIARGRLYGVRLDGIWMHVGTPSALSQAEAALGGGASP